jgi:uncharacterized membrane protein
MSSHTIQLKSEPNRVLSVDFFRGFTMFMLYYFLYKRKIFIRL